MGKNTKSSIRTPAQLTLLDSKCAGMDIGASEIFVCIAKNNSIQEVRSFLTFTADLRDMIQWLKVNGVKSVAMESTSVYWIVPYEMLEEAGFEVLLVNARFFKNVPGRKSDVKDCQWIQQLHSYGLLKNSFRPANDIVEIRSYVRQRSRLFELAGTQVSLMHKALTQMNIQLNHAISDITGRSGLNIIKAILGGSRDPKALANLSVNGCRKNLDRIEKALDGNFRKEHLFALKQAYEGYEFFHRQILECEKGIEQLVSSLTKKFFLKKLTITEQHEHPTGKNNARKTQANRSPYCFNAAAALEKVAGVDLTTIPGIDTNSAMKILSEIGIDMSRWASGKAFASWLGLCPGNKISGGKILSSKTKPTDNRAAQALRMAANSLLRSKTALGAFFRRMRTRLGAPKAITAVAHKLARTIYRMLSRGENYQERGENYYEQQYQARVLSSLTKRAQEIGYNLVKAN